MKKFICMLLAMTMILGAMLAFTSCDLFEDKDDDDEEDVTTDGAEKEEPEIPNNYQKFDNGDISFAYPANWTKTDASVVMLMNSTGAGNNITVAYEPKSDLYEKMDMASFNTNLKPILEAAGMKVKDAKIEQLTNECGTKITKIVINSEMSGVSLTQTMFVVAVGAKNYCITVTETSTDAVLISNVYNTLYVK